ncbi:TetR/AcrR family transcriptional regulator [Deinococcus psychrotolerans]|uniref:TetR/AcrR family transcriptional regulator n=1 Tax=Deinococcus psychrotolerans TaxID=2489213 RepID=A0A3G8YJF2_9DEIO|nr:TetR/AcrR family transcriptional regulator [Deinococcus psychrotolerans]AZI41571.1 TetR/AcrR family transcriptional regulator [Deinococcus psychrotolerans]
MRTAKQDWLAAGFALLREEGEQTLTIERLCAAMQLTKGAFYHHFQNAEGFRTALLGAWRERHTTAPIEQAQQAAEGAGRLSQLAAVIRPLDHALDLSVRAWSLRNAEVKAAFEEVDQTRLAYLTELHRQMGRAEPEQWARQDYAEFVGRQCLGWLETWPADAGLADPQFHTGD